MMFDQEKRRNHRLGGSCHGVLFTLVFMVFSLSLFFNQNILNVLEQHNNNLRANSSISLAFKDCSESLGSKVSVPKPTNLFTTAYKDVYQKVLKSTYNQESKSSMKRHRFSVADWTRKTLGGLDDEDRALLGEVYFNASSIFEFGLGESTYIASETNVPRYAGVDSDPVWIAQARKGAMDPPSLNVESWTQVEAERKGAHFRFYLADIGETGGWGRPKKVKTNDPILKQVIANKIPFNYQFTALNDEQDFFEVYMIDGRFRVACAALAFMHANATGGDISSVKVILHDKDMDRRGYGVLLDYTNIIAETSQMWVLQLKPNTTEQDLYELWQNHVLKLIR